MISPTLLRFSILIATLWGCGGFCLAEEPDTLITSDTLLYVGGVEHQKSGRKRPKRNLIQQFFKAFSDLDTTYIEPNFYNYAAMAQHTTFLQVYRLKARDEMGHIQSLQFTPKANQRIGPYFGWRWIFLGYTFDIGKRTKVGSGTELSLSLYSSMLGCDLMYIRNKDNFFLNRIRGFGEYDNTFRPQHFSGLTTKTLGFNVYYVLNHRKFSYPAAFAQSTVQLKSCGSWIFGFRFDAQEWAINHNKLPDYLLSPNEEMDSPGLLNEMRVSSINYRNYSLSAGYAYNWVIVPRLTFSISLMPSIGVKQMKGERVNYDSFWNNVTKMNVDFIARGALVWNNSRIFAGISVVSHFYDYHRDHFWYNNNINFFNLYVGFNFSKRKQYKAVKALAPQP